MSHVVHVLSSFDLGGQERVALDLAIGQVRAGWTVTALSLAPPPDGMLAERFAAAGARVERVSRRKPGVDVTLPVRLARWMRQQRVDLAHTHNRMSLIYGAPAAWLARVPLVHTKHGSNPRGGKRLLAGNLAGRLVDAFVAVSPETAEVARRRREVDPRRLSVITNGVDLGRFHPDAEARARLRAELGVGEGVFVVGTVGRIAVEKNQELLLRAAAPLLGPDAHLVIVGDGPLLPALEELAGALGVSSSTHFLGARNDVAAVLNALDVFVLSSTTEGLPLVIPEAMATGAPVVSTRVGGIPSVLDEGETGFLVPPGEPEPLRAAIARLQADPALARRCGESARAAAIDRFSAERMQREYLGLYDRLLAGRAPR